jgi:hypothetical protein
LSLVLFLITLAAIAVALFRLKGKLMRSSAAAEYEMRRSLKMSKKNEIINQETK